jgi:hypothetical protein
MITEKESKDLDKILKFSLNARNKSLSTEYLKEELFPNEDESYSKKLFFILRDDCNNLLYPKSGVTHDCFWANPNAESFLIKGGFNKVFEVQQIQKTKDERKEKVDTLDFKIKTWQVKTKWYPHAVSTIALIFSVYSYCTNKKDQSETQIMQESILQLQLDVKSLDSSVLEDSLSRIDTLKHK